MGRAEIGSIKHLSNKMKAKGLQRLRWYCQVCEKQMRDENGFKCHTQSEAHFRQMEIVAQNPDLHIKKYTDQFLHDFVKQLRVSHGTKPININHFYQEYIADKDHVHMNATGWTSLTQFAMHLGKEGIATVDITDKGTIIALIDNSPEALRRREALRKKEAMAKGDEEREKMVIAEQVRRAQEALKRKGETGDEDEATRELVRAEGEKITLSFGGKKGGAEGAEGAKPGGGDAGGSGVSSTDTAASEMTTQEATSPSGATVQNPVENGPSSAPPPKIKVNPLAAGTKRKNPLASSSSSGKKANPLASSGSKKGALSASGTGTQKMTEMERIMRLEMEQQKRRAGADAGSGSGSAPGPGLGTDRGQAAKRQRM